MSIFLAKTQRFTVSYYALEVMFAYAETNPNCTVAQAIAAALVSSGHKVTDFTEDEVDRIAQRVSILQDKDRSLLESQESLERPDGKPGVGTDYLAAVGALPMDMKCMYATGFDLAKARHLYCEVDKEVCDQIVASAIEMKWKELKTAFESVIVGMGGSLAGGDDDGVDLNTPEGLAELRSLGF